jgi:hypothetical protein
MLTAAIAASVVLAGCGTTTATQGSSGSSAAQAAPGIGAPVRDGKFEFVVLSVDRSKTAGPADDQSTAQGEFINVHLSVKNTGNEGKAITRRIKKLIINGKKLTPPDHCAPPQTQFSGGSAAPSQCLRQAGFQFPTRRWQKANYQTSGVSLLPQLPRAKRVQHADVKMLTAAERVDPKPVGVEELLAVAAALEAGLAALISRVRVDRH